MIAKSGNNYSVKSEKTHKNLGTYHSKAAAMHRLKQVEYFKHVKKTGKMR